MKVRAIQPVMGPLEAAIRVPGSKSLTNRALICASLAKGESRIRNASDSSDTALMMNGLNQLGILARKMDDDIRVEGEGGRLFAPKFPIPVGNAGTTLRFMLSLAALAQGNTVFEGTERMAERPIEDLRRALAQLGVHVDVEQQQSRYVVHGASFAGGSAVVRADKSSQFLSSILMIAPYARRDVSITIEGEISSSSYVGLTVDTMEAFGVEVRRSSERQLSVKAGQHYARCDFSVEADASGASYFLAAAAICGGEVSIRGLRGDSTQGDARFLSILRSMGCSVVEEQNGVRLRNDAALCGVDVDMNDMPDVVPTLAVTALFAAGTTRIRNISHLRYKESDRLHALETELRRLGGAVSANTDSLEIVPAELHGAQLETYDDHRMAMSLSLAGLKVGGVVIEHPDCVKKSFPRFWDEFDKLYGTP